MPDLKVPFEKLTWCRMAFHILVPQYGTNYWIQRKEALVSIRPSMMYKAIPKVFEILEIYTPLNTKHNFFKNSFFSIDHN